MGNITKHKRYKKLLKEFHPTKNGSLKLSDCMSKQTVWWKCFKEIDHEWEATIDGRTQGSDCPCCTHKKVVYSNCLLNTHPKLSKQWHKTKNGKLTPLDVVYGTQIKVWWKCDVTDDHEWEARIGSRAFMGDSCPFCTGRKVSLSNCLDTKDKKISKQWHPFKNGQLTPKDVTYSSNKKVWWKCDVADDHEWIDSVSHRTYKKDNRNCPFCSGHKVSLLMSLATKRPDIAKQWHTIKNGKLTPSDIMPSSNKKVWWQCDVNSDHIWYTKANNRTSKNATGCPYCNESKGEVMIRAVLEKMFINYKLQKRFYKCKIKRMLPFDFYLPDYNILIEYDGELHFKAIEYFGGKKDLIKRKSRDKIKTKFAKNNNIPLLRIPYTQFDNIEEIILNFIKKSQKS